MKNVSVCAFVCMGILAAWQLVALSQSGPAPQIAFDIPKTDIDTLLKNAPPAVDQQLRVVDMGKYSRRLQQGDIVVIPPGVLHVWTEIPEQVTYLSVRPDPDRVLPGGYVNPLLLKNQPAPVK